MPTGPAAASGMAPRRATRRAVGGSIIAQGVFSANSLIIGLIASKLLSLDAFGRYAIAAGYLAVVMALADAMVGEARVVFDRRDDAVRGALFWLQPVLAVLAGGVALLIARLMHAGRAEGLALMLAAAAWVFESGIRRIFIARKAFGGLIVNDAVWMVVAIAVAVGAHRIWPDSGAEVLLGWALASVVAVGLAHVQLPREETAPGPLRREQIREILGFGGWRGGQAVLRPGTMFALRAVVAASASLAVVGQLELGRLLTAPLMTVGIGVSQVLLPLMAEAAPARQVALARRATLLMGAGGAALVVAVGVVVQLSHGEIPLIGIEVPVMAAVSWGAFAVAFALGNPVMNLRVVERRAQYVFHIRLLDNAVGLGAGVLLALAGAPLAAPFGLAAGAMLGTAILWWQPSDRPGRRRSRTGGAPMAPGRAREGHP